jgi:cytochrome c oxidase subunit IV
MNNKESHQIIRFRTYVYILLALVTFTLISVAITGIDLGPMTVTAALLIASIKSTLVLSYFMHLKFENKFIVIMVTGVIFLFFLILVVTFLDYYYR